MNYAIIDIETTGLNAKTERITEVAILIHDGQKVIRQFVSLINPERKIPYRIRELTGIADSMVSMAPRFCEVAKEILEVTDHCYFVAHNASFDYAFIREEYARLGYVYERKTLCTKRLSQKILPGMRSYSLGNLCTTLQIINHHRHRALGDATATTRLFEYLLKFESAPEHISLRALRTNVSRDRIEALPEETGVYYLHNEDGTVIYIGKSLNIKERVLTHLAGTSSKRASEMRDQIFDVSWEICGSELIALLLESEEVKKHTPRFNRLLRRKSLQWGLYVDENPDGYMTLQIRKNEGDLVPLTTFSSKKQGTEMVFNLIHQHSLCQKLCGLFKTKGACFHHQIHQCYGACVGEESPEDYNQRARDAIAPFLFAYHSFFVIDKGRHPLEKSVVLVENQRYCGYGFLDMDEVVTDIHQWRNYIEAKPDHRDARQIIRSYIRQEKGERIIRISHHHYPNEHLPLALQSFSEE